MCGIAGIVGDSIDSELVPEMLEIIRHRGPDSRGFFLSENVHLGHCRLSINDLSERAAQPFVSKNKDVAVMVNGEIYNFRELRNELVAKGYQFLSNSDSEVILHGFLDCGKKIFSKLNGMFAIAVWNETNRELLLIRDRLGIKPLYYAKAGHAFLFASEIKALAQYKKLPLSLDLQSFSEYMAFGNYFSNRTLNQAVKIVRPGEILRFRPFESKLEFETYWEPRFSDSGSSLDDNYSRYLDIVEPAINRHLLSDVPLGSYLSSGIDSSSVVAFASKALNGDLRTYTGYFGISGHYDESLEAKKTAGAYGCHNTKVEITPQDFIDNFEKMLWHLDEPRVGMGSFSQYMVAKRASGDVKVILTGHGGDELFAGYPVFKAIFGKSNLSKLLMQSSFKEILFSIYFTVYPYFNKESGFFMPNIYSQKALNNLLETDFKYSIEKYSDLYRELRQLKTENNNEYERLTLTYLNYFLPALFIVEDKISMASSLESRTPLCDNEILDFALSIPLSAKLSDYELKHIPRQAMKDILPEDIYKLPKRGFPTPLSIWFKNDLKAFIKSYILDNMDYLNMFKKEKVEQLINKFQKNVIKTPYEEIDAYKIWELINIIVFSRNQSKRYKT